MSRVSECLNQIMSARYGKDVRQSIHDGIEEIDGVARAAQNSATANAQTASAKASEALTASQEALQKAQEAHESAQQAKVYAENAEAVTGVNIGTKDRAGIVKGGENHIAEDGTLELVVKTTETTMPNSRKGGLEVDEIGGVCEQASTTGLNRLENTHEKETTSNGGTFTTNEDGTVTINGTFTADTNYNIYTDTIPMQSGLYFNVIPLSGTFNGTINHVAHSEDYKGGSPAPLGTPKALNEAIEYRRFRIAVSSGTVCNNLVVGLIVSLGESPWEPYTGGSPAPSPYYPMGATNSYVSEIRTHGKNFLPNVLQNTTVNGVTATVNSDKSLVFNGTASAISDFYLFGSIKDDGNYIKIPKGSKVIGGGGENLDLMAREKTLGALMGRASIQRAINENDCYFYGVFVRVKSGVTANNETYYPMISVGGGEYEPYTESVITLSQPIELRGISDVQDVIEDGKVKRRFTMFVADGNENWKASSALVGRYYIDNVGGKPYSLLLCTHAKGVAVSQTNEVNVCYFSISAEGRFIINTPFDTVEEWKAHLAEKPMVIIYEAAKEVIEELPIADQIALNSLKTFDGVTYIEFDSEVQPTFKGKYGTSLVGSAALEGLMIARNNELRIAALEASAVNNI